MVDRDHDAVLTSVGDSEEVMLVCRCGWQMDLTAEQAWGLLEEWRWIGKNHVAAALNS